jgi:hypothetical protein
VQNCGGNRTLGPTEGGGNDSIVILVGKRVRSYIRSLPMSVGGLTVMVHHN